MTYVIRANKKTNGRFYTGYLTAATKAEAIKIAKNHDVDHIYSSRIGKFKGERILTLKIFIK